MVSHSVSAMKISNIILGLIVGAFSSPVAVGEITPVEWSDSARVLDEVAVTAIKETSDLSRVPASVTSIGRSEIEQMDILNVKKAAVLVPNFYIPDYGSRMTSSIYVRGLGARIDQPAIGLTVDNVPFLNKDNYDFDIADIDRIEVFRGPQSTLYGRNTLAGLVSVYTLSPLRYQGVRFMAGYGSGNTLNLSAGVYRRMVSGLGMAFTASYGSSSGFYINRYNGKKADHEKNGSIRWKTAWNATGGLSLENTASVSLTRQGGYPYESLATGMISYNDTCFYRRTGISDGLTMKYAINNVMLSSITSFQYIDDNMTLDQDFLTDDYFTLTQRRHEWALTQDFIASGKKNAYSWLGGLFGFYKRTDMQAPVTFKDDGISNLIEGHANQPGTKYPIVWDTRSFVLNSDFVIPTKGFAIYHRSDYEFNNFKFSGSLRFDYESVAIDYHNYTSTSFTMMNATVSPAVPFQKVNVDIDEKDRLSRSFVQLLPKISVEYHFDQIDVYASFAKGYKSGGYNTQMFSDVLQQKLMGEFGIAQAYNVKDIITYDPEKSWNYELGTKFSFPAVSLSGSAAIFYINCTDQQLTMFPPGVTTGRIMTNAGKTRSMGAELSLRWNPVSHLNLNLSYGYTDARFVNFNDGKNDCRDKRVPYAPANTMYASSDYRFVFGSSIFNSVLIHAGLQGVGDIYWNEINTVKQSFYTLIDASATFELLNKVSLELRAENMFNRHYDVFYFVSIGNAFLQRGKPRFLGATLRFNI